MGRFLVLLVGATLLGASYLVFGGYQSIFKTKEKQSDYQHQVIARDVAKSGFDRAMSAIVRDGMDVATTFPRTAVSGAYYNLDVTKNFFGDVDVSVEAHSNGASYAMEGSAIFTAPFPAAVMLEDDGIIVNGSGFYQISGVDRRMPTQASRAGFESPSRGIMTTGSHVEAITGSLSSNRVVGVGSQPSDPIAESNVADGFDEIYIESLYQEAILHAHDVLPADPSGNVLEGSLISAANSSRPGNPKIIRAMGNINLTERLEGYGMLIVENGDLNVWSGLDWEGLILMRKTDKDTVFVNMNGASVYGGFVAYDADNGSPARVECAPDFEIEGDETVVESPFRIRVQVLGAAISSSGGCGEDDGPPSGPPSGSSRDPKNRKKVLVCHKGNTISISRNALETHLSHHNDYDGSCQAPPEESVCTSGRYDMPVTAQITVGGETYEPWGSYGNALDGNVNTGNSGVTYSWEPDIIFPAGSAISIDAQSWGLDSGENGDSANEWHRHMEANSSRSDNPQIYTLKDESPVPSVGGFMGQYSVEEFLSDYISGGEMSLDANQAVSLFELGVTDTWSEAFDMQDLVVLITMIDASENICHVDGAPSMLDVVFRNDTEIHYSSEAIAKLGMHLDAIGNTLNVHVAEQSIRGKGEFEIIKLREDVAADNLEDEDEVEAGSNRVNICHKPGTNHNSNKSVKQNRLAKHLGHGDYIGNCGS